jgi:hypothetical protein
MNAHELVDHIRSGPTEILLNKPLRFRRRTRSNPCDFNEFLQALQSNETIQTAEVGAHHLLGVSEDEWVLLVQTLGSIKGIEHLDLKCFSGSIAYHPFQAIADAVNNAHSLRNLDIAVLGESIPRDPSGMIALANALREHTALQEFLWADLCTRRETAQITAPDPVLQSLPACPHLRKATIMTELGSVDVTKNLLQVNSGTDLNLALRKEDWLAVANEIRQGRCNVRSLYLANIRVFESDATEAVIAVASAIRLDRNLEHLHLHMQNGFADEAGVALAEALTVNTTLRRCNVSDARFGTQSYMAFAAMLRVNTNLILELPRFIPAPPFIAAVFDVRLLNHYNQMRIEQRLNKVGRGRLFASNETTREEWVDALHELSCSNSFDLDDSPALRISSLYILLQLNPDVIA